MTNKKQNVNPRILEYLRFGIYNQLKNILENIGDSLQLKLNTKLILSHKKREKKYIYGQRKISSPRASLLNYHSLRCWVLVNERYDDQIATPKWGNLTECSPILWVYQVLCWVCWPMFFFNPHFRSWVLLNHVLSKNNLNIFYI